MNNSKNNNTRQRIIVVLAIILAAILMYTFITTKAYNKVFSVFQPIIIGAVIAYLLNPVMILYEKLLDKLFVKISKKPERLKSLNRGISITLSIFSYLSVIILMLYLIIPQITSSITDFIQSAPAKVESLSNWYNDLSKEHDFVGIFNTLNEWFSDNLNGGIELSFESLFDWLQNSLFKVSGLLGNGLIAFFGTTVNVAVNAIIGFVVAIYILCSKERLFAQFKKLLYAFVDKNKADDGLESSRECNRIITKFIIGKLIDSAIIGFLCFIVMLIFDVPYPVLISFIIGVTDIIPFFGPYLGGIPCTLLILLVDPIKALYFVIIIVVIQQVEGNLISPKIIGDTIGLSPIWVLFAMIVGGGLFGLAGMLLGVPVMAIIFFFARKHADRRLIEKNMPVSCSAYLDERIEVIDSAGTVECDDDTKTVDINQDDTV